LIPGDLRKKNFHLCCECRPRQMRSDTGKVTI
jgi:hypothetical protein